MKILIEFLKVISASWHKTVEHLMALVERVWKKSSFIIFDSLGRDCHPTDHTSQLIQEMLLRNVRPVFIVTDVSALLRGYESRIRLRKGAIEWGEQVSFSLGLKVRVKLI